MLIRRFLRSDRGIALPMTALVLVPLLAAAALAVDVGGWYARAAQIQRAADAAALAGVTYLPQGVARAQQEAERVAERNGFDPDADGITVVVAQVTGTTNRLRVSITVDEAPQTFSGMFRDDVPITRSAVAEYVQPVPLGSPRNYLGTGNLLNPSIRELFWLGVTGPCGSKEQGERVTTISDANFTTNNNPPSGSNGFGGCTPGSPSYVVANGEFDPQGYFYAVEVPQGFTGNLGVQIYDAPYCSGDPTNLPGAPADRGGDQAYSTTIRVRDKDNIDPRATTVLSTVTVNGNDLGRGDCGTSQSGRIGTSNGTSYGGTCNGGSWGKCWRTLRTFTSPAPGIYYVQIDPQDTGSAQHGTNNFGLRLTRNGSFTPCSGDPTSGSPPYAATCPRVYGVTHMGVDASISGGFGTEFTFYLAEIGRQHRGKTLQIELWDTGEGAQAIQIIEPDLTVAEVDWVVLCPDGSLPAMSTCSTGTAPTGGWGPHLDDTTIDVSGTNHPQPGAHRLSSSRYNDRLIRIQVPIDDYGASTWWRIRYRVGSSPTDRTTWSAIVLGDPVRLVG